MDKVGDYGRQALDFIADLEGVSAADAADAAMAHACGDGNLVAAR